MQFKRQLEGIKWRFLWVVVALGIGTSLTFYYRIEIFQLLLAPAGGRLSPSGMPIFTAPTEMFSVTIDLVMKGGIVAAFPVAVYHLYRLASPMIGRRPRRLIRNYLMLGAVLYLGGTAFAYFIMLPTGLRFLLSFSTDIASPMIRISEYLTLVLAMLFWLGVVFELPLLMMLLAHIRLVSHRQFQKFRRYVPLAAFILGAFITPTFDAINQTLVAVPLILLYELGILLAWLVRPKGKRDPSKPYEGTLCGNNNERRCVGCDCPL